MIEASGSAARPYIDGYALLAREPARGRTAHVYKAIDLVDGSAVAVKVLSATVEQGDFLEEAFLRETRSLTELKHPGIARMHQSGVTAAGDRYIVLDWMDSDLPRWKADQGPFEWTSFWRDVGRPLVAAVAHAHARDISHRDLAPRNILFDAAGQPLVADFGIAKIRRFMRSDRTMRNFSSPPFTPPEADDGSGTMARDVFSLATLFCWAASPVELDTYEAIHAFVEASGEFPPAVRTLLLESLSTDPDERPPLAEAFLNRVDAVSTAPRPQRGGLSCLLSLQQNKVQRIGQEFDLGERRSIEEAVVEDLQAVCAIEPKASDSGEVGDPFGDLWLYGLTKSYHARPDPTLRDRLVIVSATSRPSGWLEAQREQSVSPRIDFRFHPARPEADRAALTQIQQIVDQFVRDREEEADAGNAWQIDVWSRILEAKESLETSRERPIRYHGYQVDGRRVRFRTMGEIPEGTELEKRQVRLQDGTFLTGSIEGFEGKDAVFLSETGDIDLLRGEGEISVNVYAASEAIRKQRAALDAFRLREVARARMNVALSRGKDALVIVGDHEFCRGVTGENPFREVTGWIGRGDGCTVEMVQ